MSKQVGGSGLGCLLEAAVATAVPAGSREAA